MQQPLSVTAATGNNVTFRVTAEGHGLTYHWKRIRYALLPSNAEGQYSPHLYITSVAHGDDGKYYCILRDHWGYTVKSNKALLKVLGEF